MSSDEALDPELDDFMERLIHERPVPRAGFVAEVRAGLRAVPRAPRRLRLLVAAYAACGLLLLGVAGLGVAGSGPLAPHATPTSTR